MAKHDKGNDGRNSAEFEAEPSHELVEEDLEEVAGGATSCTPDDPIKLPGDDLFNPLDPAI